MATLSQNPRTKRAARVLLCADDFAMTDGVSAGIAELAAAGRLSATSAMVTTAHWPDHAARLMPLRDTLAVGLHFNLTLGRSLGAMSGLAPSGDFPALSRLMELAFSRRLDGGEIADELTRQLDRFTQVWGHAPDFIDGHQHVHVLPMVRSAVLNTLAERFPDAKPLLRNPADRPAVIVARGAAVPKALALATLATGFGRRARRMGFPTNRGFAGVSPFYRAMLYSEEFMRFFTWVGARHLVMCHPGYPDAELQRIDPVVERRRDELDALFGAPDLPSRIWRPHRTGSGDILWSDWTAADA